MNRLRRLLGLPPLQNVVYGQAAVEASAALSGHVITGVRQGAIIEEKVAFLLQRDQETQKAMNALTDRVQELEEATPRLLDRLREDMEAHVTTTLTAALAEYRDLRIFGTIALAVGLICTTVANFV